MKAAQLIEYDGIDALKIVEVDKPKPEEGHVLVEVYAASTNPFDWKVREGLYKEYIPINLPITLGGDFAGVVVELGTGVEGFEIGQSVYGQANALSHGSYAEFATVKSSQLALKPNSINYETAAAFPLAAASAVQALNEHIDLKPNQKVLIHGGAGGIGSLAIQLAKHVGAYVATTVSAEDIEFAREIGADEVIDYKAEDFSAKLQDYDAVFDTVGGETTTDSYKVLKPGGVLVSMVDKPNDDLVQKYKTKFITQSTKITSERLTNIVKLIDDGELKVNIDKVFPFDQTASALEYLKTGHPRGKVVIKVKS